MSISKLAILGGKPEFKEPVPVGQLYFPSRELYIKKMQGFLTANIILTMGPC